MDTLYGKYIESIFDPPIVLFFTNERLDDHLSSLSPDRWLRLNINSDRMIEHHLMNEGGTVTTISLKDLNIKKIVICWCRLPLKKKTNILLYNISLLISTNY